MEIMDLTVGILFGIIIGIIAGKFLLFRQKNEIDLSSLLPELKSAKDEAIDLQGKVGSLTTENKYLKDREDEVTNAIDAHAARLLNTTADNLAEKQNTKLSEIIKPLKKELGEIQKKREEDKVDAAKDLGTLKQELKTLTTLNQTLSTDAKELTVALKGDQKTQGNWGELKLRKVLEASNLKAGSEYIEQGEGLDLKDENGKRQQPDFIINLPDDKHLIIDSKVSLVAYERYVNADNDADKQKSLDDHIKSVNNHVDELSKKHYHANDAISSPEFVFIFMGLESALIAALDHDMSIATNAWDKNIIIVSPSLMLASLKSVAAVWKHEKQTRNAIEIATKAGSFYDKLVGFVEDLDRIGTTLESAQQTYETAKGKLSTGKGNLIRKAEAIKELGAKTKKQLKIASVQAADEDQ